MDMKISDLVLRLEEIKKEYGDIAVYCNDGDCAYSKPINTVYVEDEDEGGNAGLVYIPPSPKHVEFASFSYLKER